MSGWELVNSSVIAKGLCTGCGTCVGICPLDRLHFDMDLEEPADDINIECPVKCKACYISCPGRDIPKPKMDQAVFGRQRDLAREPLGIWQKLYRATARDEAVSYNAAAGGAASSILSYLLNMKRIDAALVVGMDSQKPWRVRPFLATRPEEVLQAAQSKLAIAPCNQLLKEIAGDKVSRVAVVGLPCHIHGLRKIQLYNVIPGLDEKIKYKIGLFCGLNFTYRATEHVIVELCGVSLEDVADLQYRGGPYPGRFTITKKDGSQVKVTTPERRTFTLGFIRGRCQMCYDWANEFADISLGDYFAHTEKAWTTVIARTDRGVQLIEEVAGAGLMDTEELEERFIYNNIGFEFKVHGFGYQLWERKRHRLPVPEYHYPVCFNPLPRDLNYKHPHAT